MRILTSCYEYPPLGGGGGVVADGLGRALSAAGHGVDLVTMGFRGLPREERAGGVRVVRVPAWRRRPYHCTVAEAASYLVPARLALGRLVSAGRHDLIHAHFIFPDGLIARPAARRAGLRYVVTAHGSDVPGFNPDRLRLAHVLLSVAWRKVVRGAARVVCPSERLRGLVTHACPEARTVTIPNGFDLGRFRPDRPRQKRVLVATRMLERKGVQHLLRGIEGLALDRDVHIAGDGPFLAALRPMSERACMKVTFHGWLSNRSPEYAELFETSDVFVFPSESENFPLVLLEAMAAGTAIVTTARSGCEEVVGDAAILIPPRDPSALRQALLALDGDPERCRALGRAARRRLEERFSWAAVGRCYADLFEEVATEGQKGRTPA